MQPKYYTGIGSRETPAEILRLMRQIAKKYAGSGWVLRSGGAAGADDAFYNGAIHAHGQREIYLPWDGYNMLWAGSSGIVVVKDKLLLESAAKTAEEVHPNWGACSRGAKGMHARNVFQVLGANLMRPSQALICWAPIQGNSIKGGTRTAWEIAKLYSIPCFNLANSKTQQKFELFVAS